MLNVIPFTRKQIYLFLFFTLDLDLSLTATLQLHEDDCGKAMRF